MRGLVVTVDEGNVELDSTMAVDIVLPFSRSKELFVLGEKSGVDLESFIYCFGIQGLFHARGTATS